MMSSRRAETTSGCKSHIDLLDVDGNKTISAVDRLLLFFSGFSVKSGGDKFRACLIVKADSAVKVSITNSMSGPAMERAYFSVGIKENGLDRCNFINRRGTKSARIQNPDVISSFWRGGRKNLRSRDYVAGSPTMSPRRGGDAYAPYTFKPKSASRLSSIKHLMPRRRLFQNAILKPFATYLSKSLDLEPMTKHISLYTALG
ncbi:hypothetical protein TcasGA2_TC002703 [Tribolium castaneum]|uniref:Uncharacterized protein n=1 Tax=Tribolium castaneum TaxID=7070 RepID=D6WDV8_TRICA|nr:hypothetical protein TcasGA2_TC002703 [Tribolium castaneum]